MTDDTIEVSVDDLRTALDLIDWQPKDEQPEPITRLEESLDEDRENEVLVDEDRLRDVLRFLLDDPALDGVTTKDELGQDIAHLERAVGTDTIWTRFADDES